MKISGATVTLAGSRWSSNYLYNLGDRKFRSVGEKILG